MGDINLVPMPRQRLKRRRARTWVWVRVSMAYSTFLVLALFFVHTVWKVDNAALAEELGDTLSQNKQYNDSILRLRKELARISRTLQTSRVIRNQPDWSKLLVFVANHLDQDMVLNRCSVTVLDTAGREMLGKKQAVLSSEVVNSLLTDRQYRLILAGLGQRQHVVSQFVVQMEQSGLFDSVSLLNSQRQDFLGQSAIHFVIECRM